MEQQPSHIDVQEAFNPELRQAQQEWDAYLNSRPYVDGDGKAHDPSNGQYINPDSFFDAHRQEIENTSPADDYEKMTVTTLARKLGEAEYNQDKTSQQNISDVILEKLSQQEELLSRRNKGHDVKKESEKLWDMVMSIKDKEKARLQEDSAKEKDEPKQNTQAEHEKIQARKVNIALGSKVRVLRSSGEMEDDWEVAFMEDADNSDGSEFAIVTKTLEDGRYLSKYVSIDKLKSWQPPADEGTEEEAAKEPAKPEDEGSKQEVSDDEEDQEVATQELGKDDGSEELSDTSEEGRRARVKRLMGKAAKAIRSVPLLVAVKTQTSLERARNYYSDEERGKKRKIMSGVIGAVALAGIGAGIYLDLKSGGGITHQTQPHGRHGEGFPGHKLHKAILKEGQNPWPLSKQELIRRGNAAPTNAQIEAYDKRMARLNANVYSYYGDSAEHIPAGTELKLPQ